MKNVISTLHVIVFLHTLAVSFSFGAELRPILKNSSELSKSESETLKQTLKLAYAEPLAINTKNSHEKKELKIFNDSLKQLQHGADLYQEKNYKSALSIFCESLNNVEALNKDHNTGIFSAMGADLKQAIFCCTFALEQDPLREYMKNCVIDLSLREINPSMAMGFKFIGQAYAASKSLNTDLEQQYLNHAYDLLKSTNTKTSIDHIAEELKPAKLVNPAVLYKQKNLMTLLQKLAADDNIYALSTLIKIFAKKEYHLFCPEGDMLDWCLTYTLQFAHLSPQDIPEDYSIIHNAFSRLVKSKDDDGTILLGYLEYLHASKRKNNSKMKDAITRLLPNETRDPILELLGHAPAKKTLTQIFNYLPANQNLIELFDSEDFILIPLLEEKLLSLGSATNHHSDAINWILGSYKLYNNNLKDAHEHFTSCTQYKTNLKIKAFCLKSSDSIQQFLDQLEQIVPIWQQSNTQKSDAQSKEVILESVEEFHQKYMPTLALPHAYRMIFSMAQLPEMHSLACSELCALEEIVAQEPKKDYLAIASNKHRTQIYEMLEEALGKKYDPQTCKILIKLDRILMDCPHLDESNQINLHKNLVRHGCLIVQDLGISEKNKDTLKTYYKDCSTNYAQENRYNDAYHLILCLAQMTKMQPIAWNCLTAVEELLIKEPQEIYKKIVTNQHRTQTYQLLKKASQEPQNLSVSKTLTELNRLHMNYADLDHQAMISLQQDMIESIPYVLRKVDLSDGEKNNLESFYEQSATEHIKAGRYTPAYHMITCMAQKPKLLIAACNKLLLLEELLIQEPQKKYAQLLCNSYRTEAYKFIKKAAQKTPNFFLLRTLIDLRLMHIKSSLIDEENKINLQEKMLDHVFCGLKLKNLSPENEIYLRRSCNDFFAEHIETKQYNLAYHMVYAMLQIPQLQNEAMNSFVAVENKLAQEPQETYQKLKNNKYRMQAQEIVQRLYRQSHTLCTCKALAEFTTTQIAFAQEKELISLKKDLLEHLSCLLKHSDITNQEKNSFYLKQTLTSIDLAKQEESMENYDQTIKYYKIALKGIPLLEKEEQELLMPKMHSAIGKCAVTIGTEKEIDGKFTQAIKSYDEAIQYGNPFALYCKARTLLKNNNSKQNWQLIEQLLLQHVKTNDTHDVKALSHDKLGALYYNANNLIPAFLHLKQAADFGNFSSTQALIKLCFDGIPEFLEPNKKLGMHYIHKAIKAGNNIAHTYFLLSRAYNCYEDDNYQQSLDDIATILLSDKSTHSEKAGAMWLNALIELHSSIDITTEMVNSMRTADIWLKKNSSLDEKSIANFLEITSNADIDLISNRILGIIAGNKCDVNALDFCLISGKLLWERARQDITAHALRSTAIKGFKHAAEHGHIESQLFLLNANEDEVSQDAKICYLESSLQKNPTLVKIIQPILDTLYPKDILSQARLMRHIILNTKDAEAVKNCISKLYNKELPITKIPESAPGRTLTEEQMAELVANLLNFFIKENPLLQAAEQFKKNPKQATKFEQNSAILLGCFFTWCANTKILIQGASYLDPICKHKLVKQELGTQIGTCLGTIYFKLGAYYAKEETRNWIMAVLYFKQSILYGNAPSMAILGELWLDNLPQTRDMPDDLIWFWLTTAHAALDDADTALLIQRFMTRKIEMFTKQLVS